MNQVSAGFKKETSIPVFYSFARSGGTLVNQLLGVIPNVLVLSEVNPSRSMISVPAQAENWLALISSQERVDFEKLSYGLQVETLYQKAKSSGKVLVIRDWSTINYIDTRWPALLEPSQVLEQELYLQSHGFCVQGLVITRKYADMANSIRTKFKELSAIPPSILAQAYLAYAKAVQSYPRVALEALQASPMTETRKLLNILGLDENQASFSINQFSAFKNCTGNITLTYATESARWKSIRQQGKVPEPKKQPWEATEADRIFGYV